MKYTARNRAALRRQRRREHGKIEAGAEHHRSRLRNSVAAKRRINFFETNRCGFGRYAPGEAFHFAGRSFGHLMPRARIQNSDVGISAGGSPRAFRVTREFDDAAQTGARDARPRRTRQSDRRRSGTPSTRGVRTSCRVHRPFSFAQCRSRSPKRLFSECQVDTQNTNRDVRIRPRAASL
jgi:hypothetical protein